MTVTRIIVSKFKFKPKTFFVISSPVYLFLYNYWSSCTGEPIVTYKMKVVTADGGSVFFRNVGITASHRNRCRHIYHRENYRI